jgi:hypothetical protein
VETDAGMTTSNTPQSGEDNPFAILQALKGSRSED